MDTRKVYDIFFGKKIGTPAVVVLSGGQDSTTCAYLAQHLHFGNVQPIMFDYGQRHTVELSFAMETSRKLGKRTDPVWMKDVFSFQKDCSLTSKDSFEVEKRVLGSGLEVPNTFVNARNAMFLTAAFGLALSIGATHIYTGVSQTDYSGYPDCREDFIQSLQHALNTGYQSNIQICTPLMHLNKAETFFLSYLLGCYTEIISGTMTCYAGDTTKNEWGLGCGKCPACVLRKKGWEEYQQYRKESKEKE